MFSFGMNDLQIKPIAPDIVIIVNTCSIYKNWVTTILKICLTANTSSSHTLNTNKTAKIEPQVKATVLAMISIEGEIN